MTYVLTEDDIAVGDAVSAQLEKMWGWYLVWGIIAMIFGFFVISYRHASVYAIIYFASGFFIVGGLFEIVGAIRMARQRWLHLVFGVLWVGAGIVGFVWPHITIFIVAVLIGWGFLVLGIFDIVDSIRIHYLPYWWAYLIRGIIAVALGFLCIRHPGRTVHRPGRPDRHPGHRVRRGRDRRGLLGPARHEVLGEVQDPAELSGAGAAVRLVSFSVDAGAPRPGLVAGRRDRRPQRPVDRPARRRCASCWRSAPPA